MRLEIAKTKIREVKLATETAVRGATLFINVEELKALLLQDPRIGSIEIDLAQPGEDCRIARVFDIFEPRARHEGGDFPGALGPVTPVGSGRTRALQGVTVVVVNDLADRSNKIIDMSGPGADLSPYSQTCNVVLLTTPAPSVDRTAYYNALKTAGLRASVYLAKSAEFVSPDEVEVYDLPGATATDENARGLPRVAFIYQLHSHQRPSELGEPIFYGDNVSGLLPTIVHPNEILDGAVLCGYWNLGLDTYSIQNHPVIKELYSRHLRDLYFAGVIVTVAYPTRDERERSTLIASNLAKYYLAADGVVLTKVGGGIPETALMQTCERCEELGIKTVAIVWAHSANGGDGSLTYHPPKADAVVNVGTQDARISLPSVSRAIGGGLIGPYIDDGAAQPVPAAGAVEAKVRDIAGGLCQIGSSRMRMAEY